jgi:hypothetical protein
MIRYEVRLEVDPALAGEVERYMLQTHIPEVMATGCFLRAHFDREESGQFRTTYVAASRGEFDRYIRDHAAGLRAAFLARYPQGAAPTRQLWTELGSWEAP